MYGDSASTIRMFTVRSPSVTKPTDRRDPIRQIAQQGLLQGEATERGVYERTKRELARKAMDVRAGLCRREELLGRVKSSQGHRQGSHQFPQSGMRSTTLRGAPRCSVSPDNVEKTGDFPYGPGAPGFRRDSSSRRGDSNLVHMPCGPRENESSQLERRDVLLVV